MKFRLIINSNIRQIRIKNNLTRSQFAEKIGISVDALKKLEYNKSTPSSDTIDKICEAFNIHPIDLLITDKPKEKTETLKLIELKLQNLSEQELIKVNGFLDLFKE